MADEVKATTTYEFLLGIADRFGVPCLILAALLWMLRDAGVVLHTTVLQPVVQSHTKFLEVTQITLQELSKTADKQAEAMNELVEGQKDLHQAVLRIQNVNGKN